jgi:hypothetical protein
VQESTDLDIKAIADELSEQPTLISLPAWRRVEHWPDHGGAAVSVNTLDRLLSTPIELSVVTAK